MSKIPHTRKFAGRLSRNSNVSAASPTPNHPIATIAVHDTSTQAQGVLPIRNSSEGNVDTAPATVNHPVATGTHNTGPQAGQVIHSTSPFIGGKRSHSPEPFDPSKHARVYTSLKNKRGRSPSPPPAQGQISPHIIRAAVQTPRPDAKRFKADTSKATSPSSSSLTLTPPRGHFGSTQRRRFGLTQQHKARSRPVLSSDAMLALLRNSLEDSAASNPGGPTGNSVMAGAFAIPGPSPHPADADGARESAEMQVVELDLQTVDMDDWIDDNAGGGVVLPGKSVTTEPSPHPCNAEGARESTELQAVKLDSQTVNVDKQVDNNADGGVALPGNSVITVRVEPSSPRLAIELDSENADVGDWDNDDANTEGSAASPIVLYGENHNEGKFLGNEDAGSNGAHALQDEPCCSFSQKDHILDCENESSLEPFVDLSPNIEVLVTTPSTGEVDQEEDWEDTDDGVLWGDEDAMEADLEPFVDPPPGIVYGADEEDDDDGSEVDMLLDDEDTPFTLSSPRLAYDADLDDEEDCWEDIDDGLEVDGGPAAGINLRDGNATEAFLEPSFPSAETPTASSKDRVLWEEVEDGMEPISALSSTTWSAPRPKTSRPPFQPFVIGSEVPERISFFPPMPPIPSAPSSQPNQPQVQSISAVKATEPLARPIHAIQLGNQTPPKLSVVPENRVLPDALAGPNPHQNQSRMPAQISERVHQTIHVPTTMLNVAQPQFIQSPLPYVAPDNHALPGAPVNLHLSQPRIPTQISERVHQTNHVSTTAPNVAQPQLLQPTLPYVTPLAPFAQRTPRQPRSQAERDQRKSGSRKALERFQQPAGALEVGVPVEDISKYSGRTGDVVDEINIDITMGDPSDEDGDSVHSQGFVDVPEDDDVASQEEDDARKYKDLVSNPNVPCTNSTAVFIIDMVADLQADVVSAIEGSGSQIPTYPISESRGRARRGGVPSQPKIKHTVQHRKNEKIRLQQDVHALAKELLKLPAENLRVPTAQELVLHEKGNGSTIGPQIEDLVLDLGRNGIASSWNKKAGELFVSEFMSRKVSPCTDRDVIQGAFNTYLLALQTTYKKQVLMASADEVGKVSGCDKAKQRARYNRRSYKLERRNGSFKEYAHIAGIAEIIDEVERIPVDAMSGDETEYMDGKPYLINTKCDWRSKEGDDLFDICDALYMSTRFRSDGRPTNGRFPDPRTASTRPDTLPAPAGLPSNLYDAQYLFGLTDEEKRKLNMRPAFKFLIPVELLRIAERYRGVKSRQMKPLSREHPRLAEYTQPGTSLLKL